MRKTVKLQVIFFLLLEGLFRPAAARLLERSQLMMGNVPVSISLRTTRPEAEAQAALNQAFALMRDLSFRLSEYENTSAVGLLNQHAGKKYLIQDPDLSLLMTQSLQWAQATDGYFDPTFASPQGSYRSLQWDSTRREFWMPAGMTLGFGAIGKGYIVDRAKNYLRQNGWTDFLINASGKLWAESKHQAWKVGFWTQREAGGELCTFQLKNLATASSGTYARGLHLVNPHDKTQAADSFYLLTAFAGTATDADALATGAYVAGPDLTRVFAQLSRQDPKLFLIVTHHDGRREILGQPPKKFQLRCRPANDINIDKEASEIVPRPL